MPARPLNQLSGLPQMGPVFSGWTTRITLQRIVQTIIDGLVTDLTSDITFEGIIQPLNPKAISLKPEGQRAFEWLQIHQINASAILATNDRIKYNGKFYKIMATLDYRLNNYIEYHAIEDYQ